MKALDPTVREHARNRGKLDGADAQALEHALKITEIERDTARDQYVFMVQSAADEKLDGYRELAARLAAAESERDEARRERDKARAELVKACFYANAAAFEALDAVYAIIAAVNGEDDPRTNMQIDEMRDERSKP